MAQAKAFGPRLVVLDVTADLFGGNENVRQQVSAFLKFCFGGLARDLGTTVLLNAHPSRAGIASAELDGGLTGWNGGARSRWALVTPREDGEPVGVTARVLTKRKANYSTRWDEIRLRFRDEVLERDGGLGSGIVAGLDRRNCEVVLLELLAKLPPTGLRVSSTRNAGNYAPRKSAADPARQGFNRRDFERAMAALFSAGTTKVVLYCKLSDRTEHVVLTSPDSAEDERLWAAPVGRRCSATVGDGSPTFCHCWRRFRDDEGE